MRRKRSLKFIPLSLVSLAALIYLVIIISPSQPLILLDLQIPSILLFLFLTTVFIFSATTYLSNNKMRGFLLAFFTLAYLLLRINHLTHPFFLIILIGLFITLGLLFSRQRQP